MKIFDVFFAVLMMALVACEPLPDPVGVAGRDAGEFGQQDGGGSGQQDAGTQDPPVGEGDFINGDFEQGPGVGWLESPGTLIRPAADFGGPAYSGTWVARLGPMGDSEVITLSQRVHLSAAATQLGLATFIDSEEICDVPWYDNMSMRINDQIVEENDRMCNSDNTDDWQYSNIDISAWAGQTVTFSFRLSTVSGDALASTVYIDKAEIF